MHLLNNRICRYTYSINTTLLWPRQVMAPHTAAMDTFCWGKSLWKWEHKNNTTTKTGMYMNLFHLENGLYWVQSGVLPKKFGHKLFLSLSAQLNNVWKRWKKIIARTLCFMHQRIFRPIYIFNNYAYFLDFRAQKFPLIFLNLNPF